MTAEGKRTSSPLKRWSSVGLALIALAFLLWWGFFRTVETFQTEPVRRGNIESAVTALGVLQPERYVDVGAQATVQTNRATLASLRAQLAEQEALRDLARQQAERQQQMAAEGSTRLEDVQTAQASLRVALARIDSLKAQIEGAQSTLQGNEALLGYTRIYAPIAGTVVTLDAREGQTLNAAYQTPNVMRIADLSRMTVWTEVSEADVGRIRKGVLAYFTTLGLQDAAGQPRRWQGTLRQVLPAPPTVQGTSQTAGQSAAPIAKVVAYTALFDVDNADGALMPQMSAQVFFVISAARDVLLAPLAALTPTRDDPSRFNAHVLVDGEMQPREVRIGMRDRLVGEVLDGLKEGEALVTGVQRKQASRRLRW